MEFAKPRPLKARSAGWLLVSKKTPPPARTISSLPGSLFSAQATPARGAKLYQPVGQSGVPLDATFKLAGALTSPRRVYASCPCSPFGDGARSQRRPSDRLTDFDIFQSSCANKEN